MPAPVVASVGADNEVFSGTITLAAPSGITDGDILEAAIYQVFGDATAPTLSGWAAKQRYNVAGDFCVNILWKRASSESGSYAFVSDAVYQTGFVRRITGAIASGDPYDVVGSGDTGTSTSPSASAVTTTVAETLLSWYCGTFLDSTTVSSPPTSMSGTQAVAIYAGSREQATAASTGAVGGTLDASDTWGVYLSAIKPVAGGAATGRSRIIGGKLVGGILVR